MIDDSTADKTFGDQLEPQGEFNVGALNFCPNVLIEEVRTTLLLLSSRPEAGIFLDKLGLFGHEPGKPLEKDFRMLFTGETITCRDVQDMVDDLKAKERLSPRLDGLISKLRTQFSGMHYYFLKFSELEKGDFSGGLRLLREMEACSRYPVRIYPNVEMFNQWLCGAASFNQAKKIYQLVMNIKDQEKRICDPDELTFDLWFMACSTAKEYKEVYDEGKKMNVLRPYRIPLEDWSRGCVYSQDFRDFFVVADSRFVPDLSIFTRWMRGIKNHSEFAEWISAMFKFGLIPDDRMIREIFSKSSPISQCIRGCEDFRNWLSIYYSDSQQSQTVGSEGWTRFYDLAMRKAA